MNIFDCFTYNNEEMILDLRLSYLDRFVKKFIIVESKYTHQGNLKKNFLNLNNFKKYQHKIDYNLIDKFPKNLSNWGRENYQRNFLANSIKNLHDDDYIMISDLDEIPNLKNMNNIEKSKFTVFQQVNYSFKFNMKAFKGSKVLVESGQFYYKNPDLIRLEEKGPYKKGAVAVLGKSGKVKAHLGGGLKFIVVELAPNSHLLKSANGHPMVESDFKSLTGYLKSYIKDGMVARSTRHPVPVKGIKEKVFILDIMKRKKLWKRIAVSPRTSMPVQWWDYRDDGKLHSHATWSQFVSNRPLPDELFTIKLAKSAKKQMSDRENVSDSRNKKGKSGNSASG